MLIANFSKKVKNKNKVLVNSHTGSFGKVGPCNESWDCVARSWTRGDEVEPTFYEGHNKCIYLAIPHRI